MLSEELAQTTNPLRLTNLPILFHDDHTPIPANHSYQEVLMSHPGGSDSTSSSLEAYSPVSVPGSPLMREAHEAQLGQYSSFLSSYSFRYTNSVLSIVCSQLSRSPLSSMGMNSFLVSISRTR